MATLCPHCGFQNTAGRNVCKSCGKALAPDTKPARKSVIPFWAWFFLIPAGLIFLLIIVLGNRSGSTRPRQSDAGRAAAFVACKEFVSNNLKAPSQATFQPITEAAIADLGEGRWQVISYVDAPNSFGVALRENYLCEVTITAGAWKGERLRLGEQTIME